MEPGAVRDRLTEGVYIPADNNEAIAQLDDALEKSAVARPALRKLGRAMKAGTLPHGDPEDHVDGPPRLPGNAKCRIQYGWGPWAQFKLGRICLWDGTIRIENGIVKVDTATFIKRNAYDAGQVTYA